MTTRTASEIEADIKHLNDLLNSGVGSVVIDGHTAAFVPDSARKQIRVLENELADVNGTTQTRPRILTVRL